MALWMAVFCASMTWLFSMQFYWVYWQYRGTDDPGVQFPWWVLFLTVAAVAFGKRALRSRPAQPLWDASGQGPRVSAGYLLALVPIALAIVWLPWPYELGPWLLGAGLLVAWHATIRRSSRQYLYGLSSLIVGAILTVQIPISHYYLTVEAKNHYVKFVDTIVYYILRFLGMDVSLGDGVVGVATMRRMQPFSATWEKLGVVGMLYFLAGAFVIFVLYRRIRSSCTILGSLSGQSFVMFAVGAAYCVLRYAAMIMAFVYLMYFVSFQDETNRIDIFYSPVWMMASLLPLAVVARLLFPPPDGDSKPGLSPLATKLADGLASFELSRADWRVAAALGVAAFLVVGYHGYREHGSLKQGRILLDEKHSGWEKSHRPYDKKWYGHESTYNFACLLDYLKRFYRVDIHSIRTYCKPLTELERKLWDSGTIAADDLKATLRKVAADHRDLFVQPASDLLKQLEAGEVKDPSKAFEKLMVDLEWLATPPITSDLLKDYDVLLLKNPSYQYGEQEIADILQWVREGGGVYFIGEHTNVFGDTVPFNQLAIPMGFKFRYDCVFELDSEYQFEQVAQVPRLLPHPIAQRQPEFRYAVACSIEPLNYGVDVVLRDGHVKSIVADYHMSNFYPHVNDNVENCFGAFDQCIAVRYGRGRAVAFGDSTSYSNFGLYFPGRHELLLGTMDWLNRTARFWWLNGLFALGAIGLVVYAVSKACSDPQPREASRSGFLLACIAIPLFCAMLSAESFTWLNRVNYPPLVPHKPLTKVNFELEHSDYFMPIHRFVRLTDETYQVFFEWVPRTGNYPFCRDTLEEAIKDGDLVVIARPKKLFSDRDIRKIRDYISRGGNVLLMDDPRADATTSLSSANMLLKEFDIRMERMKGLGPCTAINESKTVSVPLPDAFELYGGEPLLKTENGAAVLVTAKLGDGTLAVFSGGGVFTDKGMGGRDSLKPGPKEIAIYNLEYALIEGLVNGNLAERLKQPPVKEAPAPKPPAPEPESPRPDT